MASTLWNLFGIYLAMYLQCYIAYCVCTEVVENCDFELLLHVAHSNQDWQEVASRK